MPKKSQSPPTTRPDRDATLLNRHNVTIASTGEKLVFEHYSDGQIWYRGGIIGFSEERLGADILSTLVNLELAARKLCKVDGGLK